MSAALQLERIEDSIPLTKGERDLKAQLEGIVEGGLSQFIEVGRALSELRSRRLYRTHYPTFEAYVRDRFGLARSTVDGVIRSAKTAESLLEAGVELAPGTTEATIRPFRLATNCRQRRLRRKQSQRGTIVGAIAFQSYSCLVPFDLSKRQYPSLCVPN